MNHAENMDCDGKKEYQRPNGRINPLFLIDFYKVGHVSQYPAGVTRVWSNWTPRTSRTEVKGAIHFGLQHFIKRYLLREFDEGFFGVPWPHLEAEYREVISATLGVADPRTDHLKALHDCGRLPLDIYSVPEGTFVPCGVPAMLLVNTAPHAFWLPNYLETLLSNSLWKASTSATTAMRYRRIFEKWANASGCADHSFIDWMGHDFSYRGTSGTEDAQLSGMGHLTSFSGTDTLPAILAAREYYGADLICGGSVPATEHSVMCAGGQMGEFETFRRLITETYPTGILSIVSDTWDLWKVLTEYVPRLRSEILKRNGKIVIRPDSGDPVKIMCGDPGAAEGPVRAGVLRLLQANLGSKDGMINNAGAIYGDSITPERAEAILSRVVKEIQISPYNCVFGIGSFTYSYVTRDTYGFAMKATAVEISGEVIPIFKKPVTDDGGKNSHFGIPCVYESEGTLICTQESSPADLDACAYRKVFDDGRLVVEENFSEIRLRVRA